MESTVWALVNNGQNFYKFAEVTHELQMQKPISLKHKECVKVHEGKCKLNHLKSMIK